MQSLLDNNNTVSLSTSQNPWQRFLYEGLMQQDGLVHNAQLEVKTALFGTQQTAITVNKTAQTNTSWVGSLINAYGPYARAETDIVGMSPIVKSLYCAASHMAEQLMHAGNLAGGIFANNWLIATNLYPKNIGVKEMIALKNTLLAEDNTQAIIFRSLTPKLHSELITALASAHFLLLPTRQVWITDNLESGAWRQHKDVQRDLKHEQKMMAAASTEWLKGEDFTELDFVQATHLYQVLYRQKYPHFNPDYTVDFLRIAVKTGWLQMFGLKDLANQKLIGMVGLINCDGVYATPVLGYDLSMPSKDGLYRRLMLKAFLTTEAGKGLLHCSGGAGSFKQQRGAKFHTEFAAIWMQHLPLHNRLSAQFLNQIVQKLALPYLQKSAL